MSGRQQEVSETFRTKNSEEIEPQTTYQPSGTDTSSQDVVVAEGLGVDVLCDDVEYCGPPAAPVGIVRALSMPFESLLSALKEGRSCRSGVHHDL